MGPFYRNSALRRPITPHNRMTANTVRATTKVEPQQLLSKPKAAASQSFGRAHQNLSRKAMPSRAVGLACSPPALYKDGGVLRVLLILRLGHLLWGFPVPSSSPPEVPVCSYTNENKEEEVHRKSETEEIGRGRWGHRKAGVKSGKTRKLRWV